MTPQLRTPKGLRRARDLFLRPAERRYLRADDFARRGHYGHTLTPPSVRLLYYRQQHRRAVISAIEVYAGSRYSR